MIYYKYDEHGLYTGTSETEVNRSTTIPYPNLMAFYRFAFGNWHLVFGADADGALTINNNSLTTRPAPPIYKTTTSTMPGLADDDLKALFADAEVKIKETKLYKLHDNPPLQQSYAVFRKGDNTYLAVGMNWTAPDGRVFNAKVSEGEVTDIYEIFTTGEFIWKELHQESFEPVAVYREDQCKLDPVTLEVLQVNHVVNGLNGVPDDFAAEILAKELPSHRIWQYASKPYGEVVAFSVGGF